MPDLPGRVPVALLPIRLETRFVGTQLLLRVYPDVLHVDSHEPELTAEENLGARTYWERVWRAAGDVDRERAAWAALVAGRGSPRAAWIARRLRPDATGRPTAPLPDDAPLDPSPVFPQVDTRPSTWNRAPMARALPTRWTAIALGAGG